MPGLSVLFILCDIYLADIDYLHLANGHHSNCRHPLQTSLYQLFLNSYPFLITLVNGSSSQLVVQLWVIQMLVQRLS